jgi:molybdopterin molybdotransferase
MALVPTLSFREARRCVIEHVLSARRTPAVETVPLEDAAGRVLASRVAADRDYPPLARSMRDGFAVRAADLPGTLDIIGEVKAGTIFTGFVGAGQAVEIMTGAPVPQGADTVVMVEYTQREGGRVRIGEPSPAGQFINPRANEARQGGTLIEAGTRLGYAEVAMAAAAGRAQLDVYARPGVAILPTGDEIVPVDAAPLSYQVRNSNAYSLAVQVRRAGGEPEILPVVRDTHEATREALAPGLQADLLLVSGGVSAGKYDVLEPVLATLDAEFYFDSVLIQPGRPLVFGRARGTFFFGLPGNPTSTMATFELFARAAVELLGGQREAPLAFTLAPLAAAFRHKPGLTRFLPARLGEDGRLTPLGWKGSSDVPAMVRANAFLVADAAREIWQEGELIEVLLK